MKKFTPIIIALVLLIGICWAIDQTYLYDIESTKVDPGALHTARNTWVVLDTTTSAGYEPNDLAVTERTYATVIAAAEGGDAEISTFTLFTRQDWNRMRFRCRGVTDGGTCTWQIYTGTLTPSGTDCELAKVGQLAFTIGTQASTTATYEMADTLVITAYSSTYTWRSASPTSNLIAEGDLDLAGADLIVAVPTTASCDCVLLGKGY